MKTFYASLLVCTLFLINIPTAEGTNWIPLSYKNSMLIDTDSITSEKNIAHVNILFRKENHTFVSILSFNKNDNTWCIAKTAVANENGIVQLKKTPSKNNFSWQKISAGSTGQLIYQNYVKNPIPSIASIIWSPVDKNNNYLIDKKGLTYKDGYAEFWIYARKTKPNNKIKYVIYRVKMNMAYQRIKTLSATSYDDKDHIVSHVFGAPSWNTIQENTVLYDIYKDLKKDIDNKYQK